MDLRAWTAVVSIAMVGCGGESDGGGSTTGEGGSGGQPPLGCAIGETTLEDGSCVAPGTGAGIPPEQCGAGFEPADDGCEPILPTQACGPGLMALPGETSCREVHPCGSPPWGDIPVEPGTHYVDASYAGGDSDGTSAKPWTTIADAIAAAPADGTLAIAEGSYVENLVVNESLAIWGRCPSLVEIVGSGSALATIEANAAVQLHWLAISGPPAALVTDADGSLVDRVWIREPGFAGLLLANDTAVRGSLIEGAGGTAIFVRGATIDIEDTVIRNGHDRGLDIDRASGLASNVTITGSLIEGNTELGLYVNGSSAAIIDSIVRDHAPLAGDLGYGIYAQVDVPTASLSTLTIQGSLIERNGGANISLKGVSATIEATMVRDGVPLPSGDGGRGLLVRNDDATGLTGETTVRNALFERNSSTSVVVFGASLVIESTIIRDSVPHPTTGYFGRGVSASHSALSSVGAQLTLRDCIIERNYSSAVGTSGGQIVIEDCIIRDTYSNLSEGHFGRGVNAQPSDDGIQAFVTISDSWIERNQDSGVTASDSHLVLDRTAVRDSLPDDATQSQGAGVVSQNVGTDGLVGAGASATVRDCLVTGSHTSGVLAYGADLVLERTTVRATHPQLSDGLGGDGVVAVGAGLVTAVTLSDNLIEQSERAGLTVFGTSVHIGGNRFFCNVIHLNGEEWFGDPYAVTDLGGNVCGCNGSAVTCKVLSTGLSPPEPLGTQAQD